MPCMVKAHMHNDLKNEGLKEKEKTSQIPKKISPVRVERTTFRCEIVNQLQSDALNHTKLRRVRMKAYFLRALDAFYSRRR